MRNSFVYITMSTNISNFAPLLSTFIYIYIRNPFNFNFILLNRLIEGILTFVVPTTLIFIFKTTLLLCN